MAYRFEQFAAQRRQPGNIALSPDGTEVAYIVDTSGQFNVWRQPIDGGWPHQVTVFDDWAARYLAWSPLGDRLCVLADKDGAERFQVFLVPARGGSTEMITDRMDVQYEITGSAFSPSGTRLAYAGNEITPENSDVFLYDLALETKRTVVEGVGLVAPVNWSPDSVYLTVVEVRSNTQVDIYLVDVETGQRTLMTEHEGEAVSVPGPWKPDGSGFYVVSDIGREFKGLAFCDIETCRLEWVETPDWDVEAADISKDGSTLVWAVNEDGYSVLHARNLTTGDEIPVPSLPPSVLMDMAVTDDGSKVVARLNAATRGTDLFTIDLKNGTVQQITFGMLGGIPESVFVEPELVRYPTFDGREIPAFLYRPKVTSGGRIPAVVSIHGGPETQERPWWYYSGLYQYLAYRGVAVLAPNIRGSTGYGKSYQTLIHHDWGGDDLRDMEHAALYLLQQDWVDANRLGVFGGSYGGFATLSCVSRLPQYWAAGAELVGPSNLITFVESVPPTWKRFMAEWVGDVETEREFLQERSPITYVDQIRCPLLVMQGANDFRVVKAESDQMVERIRARGGLVEYLVFPDEGHGFTRRANQVTAYRTTAEFFLERFGLSNILPDDEVVPVGAEA